MSAPSLEGGKKTVVKLWGDEITVTLVQTSLGSEIEYRGRNSSHKKTVVIDRKWDVFDDEGNYLGAISYEMQTRETRSRGRTYVNTRWQSPAWKYASATRTGDRPNFHFSEGYSKSECIHRLKRDYDRRKKESL